MTIDIHDGAAGLTVIVHDLDTGRTGSMTASAANGFAQVNFQPAAATCSESPYTFRPMYSTSSEHTRVPWAAHSYNVAFSDEIGHFEYCNAITGEGGDCTDNGEAALDDDDTGCFSRAFSLLVKIGGCIAHGQRLRRDLVPARLAGGSGRERTVTCPSPSCSRARSST